MTETVGEHVHVPGDEPCPGCGWHMEPEPAERGRYAVFTQPDGGLLIARAVNLCEACLTCGCGEQAEPIGPISGALVAMARAAASGKAKIPAAMQRMMGRGR